MSAPHLWLTTALLLATPISGCDDEEPDPGAGTAAPVGAQTPEEPAAGPAPAAEGPRPAYALVVHGGAGAPPRDIDPERRRAYVASLASVLEDGCAALENGTSSLDVVERIIRTLEDDPQFNAGRGAVFTHEGRHELDASIMDGRDLSCGAVGAVTTVRHPISLARAVMERTRHVLLVGEGAERFADEVGAARVANDWFSTERRREQWQRRLREAAGDEHGTVGAVALDAESNLAAATSTGGLTDKRFGRVGDSPIVGAGTYADNRSCAVSCTGTGEEFIRHGVARTIAARMDLAGDSLEAAARAVVHDRLQPGDGGIIAVSHRGEIAMVYNTGGMFRGRCAEATDVEVRIWEEAEPLPDD